MSKDASTKHGALFALSGVLLGLFVSGNLGAEVAKWRTRLLTIVPENIHHLKDHRVKGFQLMAKALCRYIEALCTIRCYLSDVQVSVVGSFCSLKESPFTAERMPRCTGPCHRR